MILGDLRLLVDAVGVCLIAAAQWQIGCWALGWAQRRGLKRPLLVLLLCAALWLSAGLALSFPRTHLWFGVPAWVRGWVCGSAYVWAFASTGAWMTYAVWRLARRLKPAPFDAGRRRLVRAAVAAPFALTGFGVFVERTNFRVREADLPVPGLPADLEGLRLVQLSDIHLSPYLSERELARAIDAANEVRARLVLVTGDLISVAGDPLDACLRQLARLRAEAGILGCLGNHEVHADCEGYAARAGARLGIRFLRGAAEALRFGSAVLNVAGVDYQSVRDKPRYLRGAERLVAPGAVNVLLSHNPDVFPVAARQGFDVTLAGHTHGGQVTVEIVHQTLNLARFITPFVYGLYREGKASVYVTRGIGTIGLPARIGAPP